MKYYFKQWQDGDVNVQKIITLTGDLTLTAYYDEGFTLAINSTPVPVSFTINGNIAQTPFNQVLITGNYSIIMPQTVGDYQFKQWSDGDTNPNKTVTLTADTQLTATYDYVPPLPEKGRLEVHAFLGSTEIIAQVEIVGVGTFTTPFTQELDPNSYTLNLTYEGKTQTKTVTVTSEQTLRVDFQIAPPTLLAGFTLPILILGGGGLILLYLASRKG